MQVLEDVVDMDARALQPAGPQDDDVLMVLDTADQPAASNTRKESLS